MRILTALTAFLLCAAPVAAAPAALDGQWRDSFGTTLTFSMCGDGTDLCAVLVDVQGKSRTESNLAFINKQIFQGAQSAANEWKGSVTFDGAKADSTVTQVADDTIEIQGCRVVILCQTLSFKRL